MATVAPVHLEGWALLRCRGALDADALDELDAHLDRECATDQHVAVDLLAAESTAGTLVAVLQRYPDVAVICTQSGVTSALTDAGLSVYESLDQATGNHAGVVRRLHDHLREDARPGDLGVDFVAGPDPLQPRSTH